MSCSDSASWHPHRAGDTHPGALWAFFLPGTTTPKDITGWSAELEFKDARGKNVWTLSSEGGDPGLQFIDGDERELELRNGERIILSEAGFPYVVEMIPIIPPMAGGQYSWRLRMVDDLEFGHTYSVGSVTIR